MTGTHSVFLTRHCGWRKDRHGEQLAWGPRSFSSSLCVFLWIGLDTLIWRFLGSFVTADTVVTLGVM